MSAQIEWDQALIEKYNYSGPRYTSYPTALEFNDGFGMADLEAAASRYPGRPLSLYVHIPFCHKLCYYCGCNKVITRHQGKADIYLDYLEREIARLAPLFVDRIVTQLHWGGGTPTFLTEPQIRRLNGLLRRYFRFAEQGEFSIEIDPRRIELSLLDVLKEEGFNRISLGVQDFNQDVQRVVNRVQDNDFIKALVSRAAELGFGSTNLDLIYGLPLQTPESFHHTLEQVVAMRPARLSVFNYAHLPSRFSAQRKLKDADMPAPAKKLAMLQHSIAYLTGQGYQFIGMDHFALPDDSLAVAQREGELHRNFQGYTTQGDCDLLGLGVSAISMVGDAYSQNHKDLKRYYAQLDELGHAQTLGYALNEDDCLRRDLIKTLICNFELEFAPLERQYGIRFADYFAEDLKLLQTFIDDGLVTLTADAIQVASRGQLLIRNICMCFDVHSRTQARRQQFSRVI
ncbi:oxygen-independent coproporphyrinogen-3 oxidase [Oceanisphaera litoralis]|uniref:oxygen-independent coproporphyrinogen III oxidase n=1 Tax=Oceanisphaera litoralis TaxID=225144 RepID=UPI0019599D00|nr:oxygen-independent coproporphyrinogen III oxidase [Oceanisphaera litoralis]MBM7456203.1 oxygen-independent coproporphyrinogen-3 oxidase [Oceanisphaera litoralis]